MQLANGRTETTIALIDGPVATATLNWSSTRIREIPGEMGGTCARANSAACLHGTFVAGILLCKRGSAAPGICPNCTLLIRPIFAETTAANSQDAKCDPGELATAIIDCIDAGAHVINLSAALAQPSSKARAV